MINQWKIPEKGGVGKSVPEKCKSPLSFTLNYNCEGLSVYLKKTFKKLHYKNSMTTSSDTFEQHLIRDYILLPTTTLGVTIEGCNVEQAILIIKCCKIVEYLTASQKYRDLFLFSMCIHKTTVCVP